MLSRLLSMTRYTVYIPVIGAWVAALMTLGLGLYKVTLAAIALTQGLQEKAVKTIVLGMIEGVDLFLLGTVFYLISLGLYELFIDENAPLPSWLVIHDLDDLKNKLLKVVVVVLGVQFLAYALNWKGEVSILYIGLAVALVVFALAYFIGQKGKSAGSNH